MAVVVVEAAEAGAVVEAVAEAIVGVMDAGIVALVAVAGEIAGVEDDVVVVGVIVVEVVERRQQYTMMPSSLTAVVGSHCGTMP